MKYMLTGIGESEIILIGNSKSKLMKQASEIAKSHYESYLENCKYLQEKSQLKYNDFLGYDISDYSENFIDTFLKGFEVQEVQ